MNSGVPKGKTERKEEAGFASVNEQVSAPSFFRFLDI